MYGVASPPLLSSGCLCVYDVLVYTEYISHYKQCDGVIGAVCLCVFVWLCRAVLVRLPAFFGFGGLWDLKLEESYILWFMIRKAHIFSSRQIISVVCVWCERACVYLNIKTGLGNGGGMMMIWMRFGTLYVYLPNKCGQPDHRLNTQQHSSSVSGGGRHANFIHSFFANCLTSITSSELRVMRCQW